MSKDVCRAKSGSSGGSNLLNTMQRGRSPVSGLAVGNKSIAGAEVSSATMPVPSTMQLLCDFAGQNLTGACKYNGPSSNDLTTTGMSKPSCCRPATEAEAPDCRPRLTCTELGFETACKV